MDLGELEARIKEQHSLYSGKPVWNWHDPLLRPDEVGCAIENETGANWHEAKQICTAKGGDWDLPIVRNSLENAALFSVIWKQVGFFISRGTSGEGGPLSVGDRADVAKMNSRSRVSHSVQGR